MAAAAPSAPSRPQHGWLGLLIGLELLLAALLLQTHTFYRTPASSGDVPSASLPGYATGFDPSDTPLRLTIPSVDADAPVEPVGVTSIGGLDVPHDPAQVGWWKAGAW